MAVAFFSRRGPGCEADGLRSVPVNCIFAKPLDSAFSALGADLDLLEIFSGLELFLCVLRVSTCHHIFPDVLHICAALLRPVVVKSSPHTACKGRRISYEPGISDICRRPALTGKIDDRISLEIRLNAGAGKHRIFQRTGEELCRIFGNDPPRRLFFLDQHISVMVQDLCIENGLRIHASPCYGRVGRSHLKVRDTAVSPAEGKSFHLVIFCQRRDPEISDHIPGRIKPDLIETLECDDISRLGDRRLNCDFSLVGTVEIVDLRPVRIGTGRVRDHSAERHCSAVYSRRVLPNDLNGRSGLAHH